MRGDLRESHICFYGPMLSDSLLRAVTKRVTTDTFRLLFSSPPLRRISKPDELITNVQFSKSAFCDPFADRARFHCAPTRLKKKNHELAARLAGLYGSTDPSGGLASGLERVELKLHKIMARSFYINKQQA